ncbi:hypothetical protein RB195_012096 [Necator americanus]|uniref:EF-hand domain-containing protein n=1 Tax=Necator americanus TaxID=51031 RepID=A0ABR1D5I6_NECAM
MRLIIGLALIIQCVLCTNNTLTTNGECTRLTLTVKEHEYDNATSLIDEHKAEIVALRKAFEANPLRNPLVLHYGGDPTHYKLKLEIKRVQKGDNEPKNEEGDIAVKRLTGYDKNGIKHVTVEYYTSTNTIYIPLEEGTFDKFMEKCTPTKNTQKMGAIDSHVPSSSTASNYVTTSVAEQENVQNRGNQSLNRGKTIRNYKSLQYNHGMYSDYNRQGSQQQGYQYFNPIDTNSHRTLYQQQLTRNGMNNMKNQQYGNDPGKMDSSQHQKFNPHTHPEPFYPGETDSKSLLAQQALNKRKMFEHLDINEMGKLTLPEFRRYSFKSVG